MTDILILGFEDERIELRYSGIRTSIMFGAPAHFTLSFVLDFVKVPLFSL